MTCGLCVRARVRACVRVYVCSQVCKHFITFSVPCLFALPSATAPAGVPSNQCNLYSLTLRKVFKIVSVMLFNHPRKKFPRRSRAEVLGPPAHFLLPAAPPAAHARVNPKRPERSLCRPRRGPRTPPRGRPAERPASTGGVALKSPLAPALNKSHFHNAAPPLYKLTFLLSEGGNLTEVLCLDFSSLLHSRFILSHVLHVYSGSSFLPLI